MSTYESRPVLAIVLFLVSAVVWVWACKKLFTIYLGPGRLNFYGAILISLVLALIGGAYTGNPPGLVQKLIWVIGLGLSFLGAVLIEPDVSRFLFAIGVAITALSQILRFL